MNKWGRSKTKRRRARKCYSDPNYVKRRTVMKVGSDGYTYELVEDFAKLPAGESFGLVSRLTTDSRDQLYVFQRKDPAVLVFDPGGKFLRSWGSGVFKRPHGFKIVNDLVYLTDQTDNVA